MVIKTAISRLALMLLLAPFAISAEEPAKSNFEKIQDGDLIYRVTLGKADEVLKLLEKGANPNATNINAMPALSAAAERLDGESAAIAAHLLDKGAAIDGVDPDGNTALHTAIKMQNTDMIWFLLSRGADFHLKNKQEQTPLALAESLGVEPVTALIKQAIAIEQQRIVDAKSEAALKITMRKHAYMNCAASYLRYYEISVKGRNSKEVDKSFADQTKTLKDYAEHMQKQFSLSPSDVAYIAYTSSDSIVGELDAMVSNQNRERLGFGSQEDMDKRCSKIADAWNLSVFDPKKKKERERRKRDR